MKTEKQKIKVYLAGKITNDWWRNEILDDGGLHRRTTGVYVSASCDEMEKRHEYYNGEYDAGKFIVTGPHSVGCDHSCFHNTHHASTNSEHTCCDGEFAFEPNEIFEACTHQINKSDIVFAYITSADAYGTLFELGFAYGINKPIYIAFKNNEFKNLHWFIAKAAKECCVVHYENDLKEFFDKIIKEYE